MIEPIKFKPYNDYYNRTSKIDGITQTVYWDKKLARWHVRFDAIVNGSNQTLFGIIHKDNWWESIDRARELAIIRFKKIELDTSKHNN